MPLALVGWESSAHRISCINLSTPPSPASSDTVCNHALVCIFWNFQVQISHSKRIYFIPSLIKVHTIPYSKPFHDYCMYVPYYVFLACLQVLDRIQGILSDESRYVQLHWTVSGCQAHLQPPDKWANTENMNIFPTKRDTALDRSALKCVLNVPWRVGTNHRRLDADLLCTGTIDTSHLWWIVPRRYRQRGLAIPPGESARLRVALHRYGMEKPRFPIDHRENTNLLSDIHAFNGSTMWKADHR